MNKALLRREYISRINRVMDYINHHLEDELDLGTISSVACFSPFHFHRIFAAMTGETLGDHIRRIRLERAAQYLSGDPNLSVTEISGKCGFSTSSAFARAFKSYFGMSASKWQSRHVSFQSNSGKTDSKKSQVSSKDRKDVNSPLGYNMDAKYATINKRRKAMKVEIKKLPGFHVAYMRHFGPYGSGVSKHWGVFRKWAVPRGFLGKEAVNPVALGISHDDPSITPPAKCRYDACAVVPADYKAEPGVNLADIPGGKYAVYRFKGTDKNIGRTWIEMYSSWLPESGFQCDDRPCFELYTAEHKCHPDGSWECDICIPVKPF
jgi:AraC family transcriptional regulator